LACRHGWGPPPETGAITESSIRHTWSHAPIESCGHGSSSQAVIDSIGEGNIVELCLLAGGGKERSGDVKIRRRAQKKG